MHHPEKTPMAEFETLARKQMDTNDKPESALDVALLRLDQLIECNQQTFNRLIHQKLHRFITPSTAGEEASNHAVSLHSVDRVCSPVVKQLNDLCDRLDLVNIYMQYAEKSIDC